MEKRLELHEMLCNIIGSRNVYFQPPASKRMDYPAVKYSINKIDNKNANNGVYIQSIGYTVTVIDYDPDSNIADKISKLPKCKFDRFFTADGLNHFVYTLYY